MYKSQLSGERPGERTRSGLRGGTAQRWERNTSRHRYGTPRIRGQVWVTASEYVPKHTDRHKCRLTPWGQLCVTSWHSELLWDRIMASTASVNAPRTAIHNSRQQQKHSNIDHRSKHDCTSRHQTPAVLSLRPTKTWMAQFNQLYYFGYKLRIINFTYWGSVQQ